MLVEGQKCCTNFREKKKNDNNKKGKANQLKLLKDYIFQKNSDKNLNFNTKLSNKVELKHARVSEPCLNFKPHTSISPLQSNFDFD